jgi:hypothetical protein
VIQCSEHVIQCSERVIQCSERVIQCSECVISSTSTKITLKCFVTISHSDIPVALKYITNKRKLRSKKEFLMENTNITNNKSFKNTK